MESRRDFLKKAAVAAAGLTIVPSKTIAGLGHKAPSDTMNIVGIGIGGKGHPNLVGMKTENIIGLYDIDWKYAKNCFEEFPDAKRYWDWRKMFDELGDQIDGVMVATPDHTHATIAATALTMGKHVYCQKPLTHSVYESRLLTKLAAKYKVATQMGNQGHNIEGTMQTVEWIQGGVIGDVKEVHLWTNRPMWRQGYFDRPAGVDIPSNLNYDVWLGPAPDKPYNPEMLHFAWRGLWDYGTGAMGDMGAHTFDAPIWALNLGMPTKIQATSTPYNKDYLPQSECVTYEFPARGNMPPVKVTWSDGGIKPARPAQLEPNRQLREALYIGDKGLIMHGTHGAEPQLIPERPGFVAPEKTLKRPSNIYVDFIEAIKEGRKAANDFEVSAKLTEIMLLTNIAVAAQRLDLTLEYDAENMRITNCPEANDYFHYEYRKGWSL